jgi:hypothetical protein
MGVLWLLAVAMPSSAAAAGTGAAACDLNGQWNWALIRQGYPAYAEVERWSNWPAVYNFSHNLATGEISFASFDTPR